MADTTDLIDVRVRPVTDEEIRHYREHGWVTLRELVSPEIAGELLARAKGFMGDAGDTHVPRADKDLARIYFQVYNEASQDDPLFGRFVHGGELGHNVARLLGRDSTIRVLDENLAVKLPVQKGDPPTNFHQDGPYLPFDRVSLNVWLALDRVTPEMGLLRFRDRSATLGALGRTVWDTEEDLLRDWPLIADYPSVQADTLNPGDATIHSSLTIHSAPANTTDDPRWAYLLTCFPGDALRTIVHRRTDDLDLAWLKPLDHERFPVIYTPEG